jgi:hypothetical protein
MNHPTFVSLWFRDYFVFLGALGVLGGSIIVVAALGVLAV